MPAAASTPDDAPRFRSPKRALALSFRLSRDRWKAKAGRRLQEIKALRGRVRDLEVSRGLWKEKALHAQQQLDALLGLTSPEEAEDSPVAAEAAQPTDHAASRSAAQDATATAPEPPSAQAAAPAAPPPDSTATRSKKNDATAAESRPGPAGLSVPGAHCDLDRIWLCLSCILKGKVPLQAVPRLLEVFDSFFRLDEPVAVPDWTTSRMWLMRLGLGQLRQPVVKADDWVLMFDHSIQLGRDRCLAVLGARLSELPRGPLCRTDLRLLHLKVMRDPDMNSNYQEMCGVVARTGRPRVLLNDHGADLRGGLRLLREGGVLDEETLDVYDIKHRCALALKYRLEDNARWAEFLSLIGKTRNSTKQTEWAFLLPPVQRSKSRYLNLGEMLGWARRTSWLIEHKPRALLEHGAPERLQEKMGWLLGFAEDFKVWKRWYQVAARTEEVVRERGLYQGVSIELRQRLCGLNTEATSKDMAGELVAFVTEQSKGVKPGEWIPGSTQVLESCFGTLKALEKDQSRSGFTGLVLGLGALLGKVTKAVVAQALAKTPIKAVVRWCEENIGQSVQSKRGEAYRLARLGGVTDLE